MSTKPILARDLMSADTASELGKFVKGVSYKLKHRNKHLLKTGVEVNPDDPYDYQDGDILTTSDKDWIERVSKIKPMPSIMAVGSLRSLGPIKLGTIYRFTNVYSRNPRKLTYTKGNTEIIGKVSHIEHSIRMMNNKPEDATIQLLMTPIHCTKNLNCDINSGSDTPDGVYLRDQRFIYTATTGVKSEETLGIYLNNFKPVDFTETENGEFMVTGDLKRAQKEVGTLRSMNIPRTSDVMDTIFSYLTPLPKKNAKSVRRPKKGATIRSSPSKTRKRSKSKSKSNSK